MRQRGRQSEAALTLVPVSGVVERIERPAPPAGMPEAQAGVWCAITASLDAEWFRPEQLPLLTQYCRHTVASNVLAEQIEQLQQEMSELQAATDGTAKDLWLHSKTYTELLAAQRGETAALVSLATKMRIAQQSTYDKSARKPALGDRPWK